MGIIDNYTYKGRSKEWAYYRKKYRDMGCSEWKVIKLTCRIMRKKFGV